MKKVAMKNELERGHEFAKQLGQMISKSSSDGEDKDSWMTSYAEDLVVKVLDSFTNTIMLFNNHHPSHHVSADYLPANSPHKSHNQSSSKRKGPTIINKYGTTCSLKKRKLNTLITWEEDSRISPKQDGYVWRKYGEKIIQHAKYPRSYFRCSYKHEKGCEATKQVQRIQDEPPLFKTTYFGYHICSNPHFMFDHSNDLSTSSFIISFRHRHHHQNKKNSNNNTPHNNNATFNLQKNNITTFLPSLTFPSSINNINVPSSSWNVGQLNLSPQKVLPIHESDDLVDLTSASIFDPFEISSLL